MNDEYDQITAEHYSAFRPFLHQPILNKCLQEEGNYSLGLDIGCGTGQSSIALANYCDKVIGIEPSKAMLDNCLKHPKVAYKSYNGVSMEFENNSFDIITFAGSLYYAKSQELLNELIRVSEQTGKIIVYDFEILLNATLSQLNIKLNEKTETKYNHHENFSGLSGENLKLLKTTKEQTTIHLSSSNVSHLLLSSKSTYVALREKFGPDQLYSKIKENLNQITKERKHKVLADIYYTIYKIEK